MKKISVIGATLVAAAVLCAAPVSLHLSQDKGLSLSVDKAGARYRATSNTREHCWRPPQTGEAWILWPRILWPWILWPRPRPVARGSGSATHL